MLDCLPSSLKLYEEITGLLQGGGQYCLAGMDDAHKMYLLALLIQYHYTLDSARTGSFIIVDSDMKSLKRIKQLISVNCKIEKDYRQLSSLRIWGVHRFASQSCIKNENSSFLSALASKRKAVYFADFPALFQRCCSPKDYIEASIILEEEREYDFEALIRELREIGYREVDIVDEAGHFAIKGGILDIFSPSESYGIRGEFFLDKLISLKRFDPTTNISFSNSTREIISPKWVKRFSINHREEESQKLYDTLLHQGVPKSEREYLVDSFSSGNFIDELNLYAPIFLKDPYKCFFDFIGKDDFIIFMQPLEYCLSIYKKFMNSLRLDWLEDLRLGRFGLSPEKHYLEVEKIKVFFGREEKSLSFRSVSSIEDTQLTNKLEMMPLEVEQALASKRNLGAVKFWMEFFQENIQADLKIIILSSQPEHLHRILGTLDQQGLDYQQYSMPFSEILCESQLQRISIAPGSLSQSVWDFTNRIFILPEHVLFDESYRERYMQSTQSTASIFKKFQELESGGLIVHAEHGVGRYLGMKEMEVSGVKTDFLVLEYADKDRIYLPVHRLNFLQKYSSPRKDGGERFLDKLRNSNWLKRRDSTKKRIRELADELLRIYAYRQLAKRDPYSPLNKAYFEFEGDFQYSETFDQQKAIDDVNADLSRDFPMDRLICGDVGFGKTEVALRASMRVVLDGKQVLVLAPTTLLSFQHFNIFQNRFRKHGVEVRLINRFIKTDDSRKTIDDFFVGKADILIGTHRILSKDIHPKNLGLLIIDEEQRFGVKDKEAVRRLKSDCDVLALTATPIPRSLHLSLLGVRDISIIATPPTERLAIKTFVSNYDENIIATALMSEAKRGGQSFFIHNRIQDIDKIRYNLGTLVPSLKIVTIHGRMKDGDIESSIIEFIDKKYDILVCTSIIESGIDIPNVNTIIVNNAEMFGLSQLYQMRGRVGRSSRQAYAYFMTRSSLIVGGDLKKRLDILAAHEELGLGFQIASYDLELRGAGNLLGGEQSGHVEEVGYDMYMDLLEREMGNICQNGEAEESQPDIRLKISASLPPSYIGLEGKRLSLYKSLFSSKSLEEVQRLLLETEDQYGRAPQPAKMVFALASLNVILKRLRVLQIQSLNDGSVEVRFGSLTEKLIEKISDIVEAAKHLYKITSDYKLIIFSAPSTSSEEFLESLVKRLIPFII